MNELTDILGDHAAKTLQYASGPIMDRRRRLLIETRRMIAHDGMENFSVRKLCQKAGVAPRTLYNAFGSRERLIALAIAEGFNALLGEKDYVSARTTLMGILERTTSINRLNLPSPNYAAALSAIYFQPDIDREVWDMIQSMSTAPLRPWIDVTRTNGELRACVGVDQFLSAIAHVQFATILDWINGRLDDNEYLVRMTENMLMLICGATSGATEKEARDLLTHIRTHDDLPPSLQE